MRQMREFRTFLARGHMLDLATGVIIGGALGKIVTSLVDDVLMPPLGLLLGKVDFSSLFITLDATKGIPASLAEARAKGIPTAGHPDRGRDGEPAAHGFGGATDETCMRLRGRVAIRTPGGAVSGCGRRPRRNDRSDRNAREDGTWDMATYLKQLGIPRANRDHRTSLGQVMSSGGPDARRPTSRRELRSVSRFRGINRYGKRIQTGQ